MLRMEWLSSFALQVSVGHRKGTLVSCMGPRKPLWRSRPVARDIIQWDVGTWKHALHFWDQRVGILKGKLGLEIGSRDLALQGCNVVCSDLNGPTARAKELHRRYGVSDLVSYERVDVTRIPYPDDHFDVVIFKSVLGALGRGDSALQAQREAVREIRRVLKAGARLLFAENVEASAVHRLLRRYLVPWGRDWHYLTQEELTDLLSEFADVDLSFRGFTAALGRREWQRSLLHVLDSVTLPLLPASWRYVAFGSAVK
jgi:SAM-dependent methyltransferase